MNSGHAKWDKLACSRVKVGSQAKRERGTCEGRERKEGHASTKRSRGGVNGQCLLDGLRGRDGRVLDQVRGGSSQPTMHLGRRSGPDLL